MKKILIIILGMVSMMASAQTMRRMWISMPDSIVPYLTESNRTELADYVDLGMEAVIQNQLKDTTRIKEMKNDYIDVQLSAASRLQMKLLSWKGGAEKDTLLCMVVTHYGPAAESRIAFYDRSWQQLTIEQPLPSQYSAPVDIRLFVTRPDSISDGEYEELITLMQPEMVSMELSPTDNSLIMGASLPPMSRDDISRIKGYIVQRKFNWDGRRFN
jgi:hypothetical protein